MVNHESLPGYERFTDKYIGVHILYYLCQFKLYQQTMKKED